MPWRLSRTAFAPVSIKTRSLFMRPKAAGLFAPKVFPYETSLLCDRGDLDQHVTAASSVGLPSSVSLVSPNLAGMSKFGGF